MKHISFEKEKKEKKNNKEISEELLLTKNQINEKFHQKTTLRQLTSKRKNSQIRIF